jgi:hypothetical protein
VLSYVLSIYIASIFNIKAFHEIPYGYKSPNTLNEEMIKIAKTSSLEKDDVTVIGYIIPATYPAMLYINKQNKLPQLNMLVLFKKIGDDNQIFSDGEKYLFSRLKQQLQNSNNKLFYVEVGSLTRSFMCEITFLEYYLRDPEFKEIFLKNYKFLNRIISVEKGSRKAGFYKEESDQIEDQKFSRIIGDIEVYVRK